MIKLHTPDEATATKTRKIHYGKTLCESFSYVFLENIFF